MFSDIHINHVSLAKRSLVNAANYRVANVSGNISKLANSAAALLFNSFFKKITVLPQLEAVWLIVALSWSHADYPACSRGLTLASYRYFLRVDDKMEAAS